MGGELPARISSITAAKLSNLSTMPMELTVGIEIMDRDWDMNDAASRQLYLLLRGLKLLPGIPALHVARNLSR